ncbi:unnamed protein product, partial [Sphenostylis stenocarpa]
REPRPELLLGIKILGPKLLENRSMLSNKVCDNKYLSDICGRKSCFYEMMRKVGNMSSVEKVNWEFCHWYYVGATHIAFNVIIKCDKTRGLRAEFRGSFKCTSLVKELKSEASLILREVNTKPTEEAVRKLMEGIIKGREYIIYEGGSEQRATVVNNIVNTGATFNGDGNGSKYENCDIVMNSYFNSSPEP